MDVYYHKKCCSGFTYTYQLREPFTENQEVEDKLIDCFFQKIELRVLKDKEALFLTELLLDLKEMSYEFGLDSSPRSRLTHTYQLKKTLLSRLRDKINIVRFGNHDAVISKEVDPLSYSYAIIKGHRLDRKEGLQQRTGTLLIAKNRRNI